MTVLQWDQLSERRFETGVDRGVLYLTDGRAVPWNGLASISEDKEREVKPYFLDGIKYLDHHAPGVYSAKLGAFTYPDELEDILGSTEFVPGVMLHDQRVSRFHLSYRTLEGNVLEGIEANYKIHIVYNIIAVPSTVQFNSLSNSSAPEMFEWNLTGTPNAMVGARPTNHLSLHSRTVQPAVIQGVEELLYGTSGANPNLPQLSDLLTTIEGLSGGL